MSRINARTRNIIGIFTALALAILLPATLVAVSEGLTVFEKTTEIRISADTDVVASSANANPAPLAVADLGH